MGSRDSFGFSVKTDKWDHYAQYRPSYPESMFQSWLEYHQGPLDSIMDVGTGGGVGAARLLTVASAAGRTPKHVYLSDPNENNLSAAKNNFRPDRYPGIEFHFHRGPAEEPFPDVAPGTIDMVISCASIHWTDIAATMETVFTTLRRGGTFGAVVYPQPTIRGDDGAAAALAAVFEQRRRFQDADDAGDMKEIRARAYRHLSIGLDFVPFDPALWTSVRRRTANLPPDGKWPLQESTWKHYGEPTHAVVDGETVELPEYDEWWSRRGYTIALLKEFFQTLGYESFVMDGRLWETDAFKTLEQVVEKKDGSFELLWPVATVLARKK